MIEAVVESISINLVTQNRLVTLKEIDGDRQLLIWIGEFEAQAIALELRHEQSPRPLPYDLLRAAIEALGGAVENVLIADVSRDVFVGRVVINHQGSTIELDSRASDAIALALRCGCSIFINEQVMEIAGVTLEDEEEVESEPEQATTASQHAEVKRSGEDELGIFREFIDTLDLDDFGRPR